jgi:hypothetical protein
MSSDSDKKTEETATEKKPSRRPSRKSSEAKAAPVKTPPPVPPVVRARRGKMYTFEQWAKRRGIPTRHKGGLRAYVDNVNKPRTLEEWETCFKDY